MDTHFDIHALPIKTITRKIRFPDGYYVGKAGIQFRNWQKEWEFLCGFSCSQDEQHAKLIAYYELLERLVARYEIQCKIQKSIDRFQAFSWPTCKLIGPCNPGDIFLGKNPFSLTGVEAAGLALRKSNEEAAEHAVLELLERHLCAKIWFTEEIMLFKVKSNISFHEYEVNFYTVDSCDLPFVIAEIISNELKISSYGHAIRKTFHEASQKAFSEALMLLDCLLQGDNGICSNERTKKRIFSLHGDVALERNEYLQSKVIGYENAFPEREFACVDIAKQLIGNESDISIVPLLQDDKITVVRALSPKVETLAFRRYLGNLPSATKILDPFC